MGLEPTTAIEGEPARSFRLVLHSSNVMPQLMGLRYDPSKGLFEQFAGDQPSLVSRQDSVRTSLRDYGTFSSV
jgi:hypothetical protein